MSTDQTTAEHRRLEEAAVHAAHWRRWGSYLSDRQWGTVREDYSPNGCAWDYFPHDHARSRAYRWGEDGLLGISDNHQRLCFGLALWNGQDEILKERLFGLTNGEGNHGEDVKEYYFYLDNTPTHSYMKALYKYPQAAYPYKRLVEENRRRGRGQPEFELMDTGIFDQNRYFDVFVEYAKGSIDDVLIRITMANRAPDPAPISLLPTLWFQNDWSWRLNSPKPVLKLQPSPGDLQMISAEHHWLGNMWLSFEKAEEVLFTENETNADRLFNAPNLSPYVKDAFHRYVIQKDHSAVNPRLMGTKAAPHYVRTLASGESCTVKLRLTREAPTADVLGLEFDRVFDLRRREADDFYGQIIPSTLDEDSRNVQRQAFAGMLWSKQFYHYVVRDWLDGDSACPPPPPERKGGRNRAWEHLYNKDILSMPDKWEYPWYAAWDLAFHCIPLAMIDPDFAKRQLILLTREWYMHPNGQIPAYEWAFGDVNPPVHAWAAWRVYKIEKKMNGQSDLLFLERVFQKLLLNFTWWVNRKDEQGKNIFQGGFLGLDNIGVFDRNTQLPTGGSLEQSDGTSWMAMYCLNLLTIALELAQHNPAYEDIASKFFEHFLYIADAMARRREESLWDEEDGFFYDSLLLPDGRSVRLKLRSIVGLIPLFAVETVDVSLLFKLPRFAKRMDWFMRHRPDLAKDVTCNGEGGACERRLLSIATPERLKRILERCLSENEFLSPYGIRALSRFHKEHPYIFDMQGSEFRVDYEPAESAHGHFGGNSNWRGPVWMPVNFLLIESLQKFHHYLGDDFKVECPQGSGHLMTLWEVSMELSSRVINIFLKDPDGRRAVHGGNQKFQTDPHWKDYLLFYEYFHGDNGAGIGANHQTGWTGLVAKLIQQRAERL